jgi:hypothetical protein
MRRPHWRKMTWASIVWCVLILGWALGVPATASAAETFTITPPSNPQAGTTIPVTVGGASQYTPYIKIYAVPNATACSANPTTDYFLKYPEGDVFTHTSSAGFYSGTIQLSIPKPGVYLLCGYLGVEVATASAAMTVGPSEAEEAETKAAKEAAEAQAKKAALARARELAEQAPITFLRVKILPPARVSEYPGSTFIHVETNEYAYVTIKISRNKHTATFAFREKKKSSNEIWWGPKDPCKEPDHRYSYRVSALGGSGKAIVRTGRFWTRNREWCAASRHEREAQIRKEEREEGERISREKREQERWETNCRQLGGTPVVLQTKKGPELYCRSRSGGAIPVPN